MMDKNHITTLKNIASDSKKGKNTNKKALKQMMNISIRFYRVFWLCKRYLQKTKHKDSENTMMILKHK